MGESRDLDGLVADLETRIGDKLGLRRGPLGQRMRRAGRRLPAWVHRDAGALGEAVMLDGHPKLRRRIDRQAVLAAHQRISRHLDTIDPRERRKDFWLGLLGSMALNLLAVAGLVIGVLKWRGLI